MTHVAHVFQSVASASSAEFHSVGDDKPRPELMVQLSGADYHRFGRQLDVAGRCRALVTSQPTPTGSTPATTTPPPTN